MSVDKFTQLTLILALLLVNGCSTVAERSDGETLSIRGIGKAVWKDGTSIEGKPLIEMPELPPIKYEN